MPSLIGRGWWLMRSRSWVRAADGFEPALDLLKKGAIDVDSLISEEYPLTRGLHAMERAGKKGVMKVFLRP